ncbi:hypothetical protein AAE478_001657 [Parahypoxylon ruwenzoriense]
MAEPPPRVLEKPEAAGAVPWIARYTKEHVERDVNNTGGNLEPTPDLDRRFTHLERQDEYRHHARGMQLATMQWLPNEYALPPEPPVEAHNHTLTPGQGKESENPPAEDTDKAINTRSVRDILSERGVNGIWDPSHNADITVHLKMSIQEDLDESLEEFCRLQRLGDFASARKFFMENLRDHIEKPYVFIAYAEMLLEQGDYHTLSEIDGDATLKRSRRLKHGGDEDLLMTYWKLIQVFVAYHKPGSRPFRQSYIVLKALNDLRTTMHPDDRDVSSTEARKSDSMDLCERIRNFIKDWSSPTRGYDPPTTLALLDVLVSHALHRLRNSVMADVRIGDCEDILNQCTPLVLSIIENDPKSMKCRPFSRWMLAKVKLADDKDSKRRKSQQQHLASSPGMVLSLWYPQLPHYIPLKKENPGWKLVDGTPELECPVRTVVKTSRALCDYHTEAMALEELIVRSKNPVKEFEELSNLQKLTQGDIYNYLRTLIPMYLISNTEDSRDGLRKEVSEIIRGSGTSHFLQPLDSWVLRMLQYSLENDEVIAERTLQKADRIYKHLPRNFRQNIDVVFPDVRQRVSRLHSLKHNRYSDVVPNKQKEQLSRIKQHEYSNLPHESAKTPKNPNGILKSHMFDGKRTNPFEDVGNPSQGQDMSHQCYKDPVKGPNSSHTYQLEPQTRGKDVETAEVDYYDYYGEETDSIYSSSSSGELSDATTFLRRPAGEFIERRRPTRLAHLRDHDHGPDRSDSYENYRSWRMLAKVRLDSPKRGTDIQKDEKDGKQEERIPSNEVDIKEPETIPTTNTETQPIPHRPTMPMIESVEDLGEKAEEPKSSSPEADQGA